MCPQRLINLNKADKSSDKLVVDYPTGAVDPKLGIFLSALKISDWFFILHAIKKTVPFSFVSHTEMRKPNGEK